jgi:[ribosomal protein S5]-alanine N-acetyltransferase
MILHTDRLLLRDFTEGDAAFLLELFNDSAFHRFIGDKGVRTEEAAREYLTTYYISSYALHGFGPYCVILKKSGAPIGMCGILKRAWLPDPDIGYAFLPEARGHGYATEAGRAVVQYAQEVVGLARLVAIIANENQDSVKLINSLGFSFETMVRETEEKPEVALFSLQTAAGNTP